MPPSPERPVTSTSEKPALRRTCWHRRSNPSGGSRLMISSKVSSRSPAYASLESAKTSPRGFFGASSRPCLGMESDVPSLFDRPDMSVPTGQDQAPHAPDRRIDQTRLLQVVASPGHLVLGRVDPRLEHAVSLGSPRQHSVCHRAHHLHCRPLTAHLPQRLQQGTEHAKHPIRNLLGHRV